MRLSLFLVISFLGSFAVAATDGVPVGTVVTQLANLSILVGTIFFFTRKTISEAFKEKRKSFLSSVDAASKSKKDAEEKLKEVTQRLETLKATSEKQIEEAKKNAVESYRVQLADAKNTAEKIKSMAMTSIEYEVQRQVENLRVETFQKSAGLAEREMEKSLTPDQLKVWNSRFANTQGAH